MPPAPIGARTAYLPAMSKRLPPSLEKLLGLVRREQPVADEPVGQFAGVLGRPFGGRPADLGVEPVGGEQTALAERIEKAVGGDGRHVAHLRRQPGRGCRVALNDRAGRLKVPV